MQFFRISSVTTTACARIHCIPPYPILPTPQSAFDCTIPRLTLSSILTFIGTSIHFLPILYHASSTLSPTLSPYNPQHNFNPSARLYRIVSNPVSFIKTTLSNHTNMISSTIILIAFQHSLPHLLSTNCFNFSPTSTPPAPFDRDESLFNSLTDPLFNSLSTSPHTHRPTLSPSPRLLARALFLLPPNLQPICQKKLSILSAIERTTNSKHIGSTNGTNSNYFPFKGNS